MKYNLQFIKISPNHQIAGVGFAGNIFIVLNSLTNLSLDDELYVDMETHECITTQKDIMLHDTLNSWEYYFNQTEKSNSDTINIDSLGSGKLIYNNRHDFLETSKFNDLKNLFFKNFKIKNYISDSIEEFHRNFLQDKVTLGVQIRLTDMMNYHNVSSTEKYIKKIESILEEAPEINQIFISTDDWEVIELVEKHISRVKIIYHKNMFRADKLNKHLEPYDRLNGERELHRYKLGIECMEEIFTLTKCDYLLQADISSISIVSTILSENIKKVYVL